MDNVKVADDDSEFLSHEMRSKFAIVVRSPPTFLCHCSRKSNASFPAAALLADWVYVNMIHPCSVDTDH